MASETEGVLAEGVERETIDQGKARSELERRNAGLLSVREFFERAGYGGTPPQFINILFWLSAQSHPLILFLIGILNGLKTILSVFVSNVIQEYEKLHSVSRNTISGAGVLFGFSFLFLAFGILLRNIWVFSAAFLVGGLAAVLYGDLSQHFMHSLVRRERITGFVRAMAHWGVIVTAGTLLLTGYLLDAFPMGGSPLTLHLMGRTFHLQAYGYLYAFLITAFSFILAGYVTSLIHDTRAKRSYPFKQFLREHHQIMKYKIGVFVSNKYIALLTIASILFGLFQIVITSYAGIAMYKIFDKQYSAPFIVLAIVFAIAIIASFTGPFFTQRIHRSSGLTPTLVFGTLLTAILPLVLVYNTNVAAITAALCMYVIGSSIAGFAQGMLAQKLIEEELRHHYFQAQSYVLFIPYLVLIPIAAWFANSVSLDLIFMIVAAGLVAIVMPLYFSLVWVSQHLKL